MLRTSIVLAAFMIALPINAREVVTYKGNAAPGAIIIKTKERRLYWVREDGTAIRYQVAVGKPAKQWLGEVAGRWKARRACMVPA